MLLEIVVAVGVLSAPDTVKQNHFPTVEQSAFTVFAISDCVSTLMCFNRYDFAREINPIGRHVLNAGRKQFTLGFAAYVTGIILVSNRTMRMHPKTTKAVLLLIAGCHAYMTGNNIRFYVGHF